MCFLFCSLFFQNVSCRTFLLSAQIGSHCSSIKKIGWGLKPCGAVPFLQLAHLFWSVFYIVKTQIGLLTIKFRCKLIGSVLSI